jgi:hypothetical protein
VGGECREMFVASVSTTVGSWWAVKVRKGLFNLGALVWYNLL